MKPQYTVTPVSTNAEARYLFCNLRDWHTLTGYGAKWPPALENLVNNNYSPTQFDLGEIEHFVEQDKTNAAPSQAQIDQLKAELESGEAGLQAFFGAHFGVSTPSKIDIYVTRYGAGGSYHPCHDHHPRHPLATFHDAISVRCDRLRGRTHLQNIAHETIHLILHKAIEEQRIGHNAKELLIDKICSCDQLKELFGCNYPNQDIAGSLPVNWTTLVPTSLTWRQP